MSTPLASTTVLHGMSKRDVAVPVGTTVASLMRMLEIDPTSMTLAHPDGTPVGLEQVIGPDLPSGAVLTLSGSVESATIAKQVATRAASPWLRPTLVLVVFLTLMTSIETACLIGPALGWWFVPVALRVTAAVICAVTVAVSLRWWRLRNTAPGLLATTTLIGICGTAALPPSTIFLSQLAVAVTTWTALMAALCIWLIDKSALSATLAAVWGAVSLLASFVIMWDIPITMVAPLVMAVATIAVSTIPSFAFRIPETQLLDLPTVTTSAPTVRAPQVAPPSPITAGKIRRTISEATARDQLLLIVCCSAVGITAFPASRTMGADQWTGVVGTVMMVTAFLSMALVPRARRDRLGRILPRISALLILIAALTTPSTSQALGSQITTLILTIMAATLSIAATALAKARPSALIGRMADITQTFSVFLLLPAAIYAAGLFDLVRQMTS